MKLSEAEKNTGPETQATARPLDKLNPDWVKSVAAMSANQQVEAVKAELSKRNPGFDGNVMPILKSGVVTHVDILTLKVKDISPLLAFPKLESIGCYGYAYEPVVAGDLTDLSPLIDSRLTTVTLCFNKLWNLEPLKNLKLTHLDCYWTAVSDLSAISNMKLTWFNCGITRVSDLSPLKGMPLEELRLNSTRVSSLGPLKGMSLKLLHCRGSQVTDLSPLAGMPLEEIQCNSLSERDAAMLRAMPSLKKINETAASVFWKEYDAAKRSAPKK